MSERRFIDANVFLRYLLRDDVEKADRVRDLMVRLELGTELAVTNHVVVSEVIFTLQKSFGYQKSRIQEAILALMRLRGLRIAEAATIRAALQLYVERNISYGDALSAIWMRSHGITEVYSWDREFNRVPWLERFEP